MLYLLLITGYLATYSMFTFFKHKFQFATVVAAAAAAVVPIFSGQ
jgi:hypothetical protein